VSALAPGLPESNGLPLIGREVVLIAKLAKELHMAARRIGDYSPLVEIPRGNTFEVRLADGRIAKVTITLDRVEPHPKDAS
jgi:hypothetical protein